MSLVLPLRKASHGPPENIKDRAVMLVHATAQKSYKTSLTYTVLALEAKPPGTGVGRSSLSTSSQIRSTHSLLQRALA